MAIRSALRIATGDVIVVQDADLEYTRRHPAVIEPIARGEARVVYGSLFLRGRPRMRVANYVCNRLLAAAANLLYGARSRTSHLLQGLRWGAHPVAPAHLPALRVLPEVTARVRLRASGSWRCR